MKIAETGFWDGKIAHHHHVYNVELSNWICNFLLKNSNKDEYVIDFGCGLGNYLDNLQSNEFPNLIGIEGDIPEKKVFKGDMIKQDLTKPFNLGVKGTIISLEVAEHIPSEYTDIYLNNIDNHCNEYLIMSWAIRNQAGFGHVNCLNNDEVIKLLENRNYKLLSDATIDARNVIQNNAFWFKNTLLIFKIY